MGQSPASKKTSKASEAPLYGRFSITPLGFPDEVIKEYEMYRILIIEDDFTIASLMKNHLEKWNFTVKCAEDFHNVMGEFTGFDPHIVLADVDSKCYKTAEMALCYLRLDSCSNDLVIKKYSIDDIIRKAVHRYAPQFIRRRIRLVYAPSGEKAVTDEKWLLFIIEQLLSNAVKYNVKGSVTISFAGDVLTVSDTGIGISQEDIPRIFEKGYTGLGGRTDRKSTGLGLYLCKKAADLLGHRISVTSEIGRGSSFSVDLSREKIDIE